MSDRATFPLTKFAFEGNALAMRKLLATGQVDREDLRHALQASCSDWTGHEAPIHALIEHGVDVNEKLPNGHFPLEMAVSHCNPQRVRIFLDAGANVHAPLPWGGLYLVHLAAQIAAPEVLKTILSAGADPNHKTGNGRTPADHAIENGHADCLKLLLAAGAELPAAVRNEEFWSSLRKRLKKDELEERLTRIPGVERLVRAALLARGIDSAMGGGTMAQPSDATKGPSPL